nr:MAG TPA: hypothetical protein [Microviridae sp.]
MGDAGLTVKTMGSLAERGMQIASDQLINQENRKHGRCRTYSKNNGIVSRERNANSKRSIN